MTSAPHVILIHGLGRSSIDMILLQKHLNRVIPEASVHRFSYRSRRGTLAEMVRELKSFVERVVADEEVSFVGHSLGGVVVRALDLESDCKAKFHRLVMLGSPNTGTTIAKYLSRYKIPNYIFGPVLKELACLNLASHPKALEIGLIIGKSNSRYGYLPFFGEDNDGLVTVREAFLESAKDIAYVRTVHGLMPFSKKIFGLVANFLENGKFST